MNGEAKLLDYSPLQITERSSPTPQFVNHGTLMETLTENGQDAAHTRLVYGDYSKAALVKPSATLFGSPILPPYYGNLGKPGYT